MDMADHLENVLERARTLNLGVTSHYQTYEKKLHKRAVQVPMRF